MHPILVVRLLANTPKISKNNPFWKGSAFDQDQMRFLAGCPIMKFSIVRIEDCGFSGDGIEGHVAQNIRRFFCSHNQVVKLSIMRDNCFGISPNNTWLQVSQFTWNRQGSAFFQEALAASAKNRQSFDSAFSPAIRMNWRIDRAAWLPAITTWVWQVLLR